MVLVIVAGLWFTSGSEPPGKVTRESLEAFRSGLLSYGQKNGRLPENVDELVADGYSGAVEDAWGMPLRYRALEGGSVEIMSPGADGKQGGHMFKKDTVKKFRLRDAEGRWIAPEKAEWE